MFHLLPALEHLSSRLRTVTTPTGIHTGFAWLGYGTMVSQTKVLDFVSLLRFLGLPQDELQMADNYFTILGNQVPGIWFDHGIELGGGVPFTAGQEGHERNQRHIVSTYMLNPRSGRTVAARPSRKRLVHTLIDLCPLCKTIHN